MASPFRRILFFAVASIGGLGLLAVLMLLFAQPQRPTQPSPQPATPTPGIVVIVNDEPILFDEWRQAMALDHAMSTLVGQTSPNPEQTLNQLIKQHLVLQAAQNAGLPQANQTQAEAWLTNFLMSQNMEEETLEQTLAHAGLSRADLTDEIVPRLLRIQQAMDQLSPNGDGEAWADGLRRQARVEVLENISAPELPNLPTPAPNPAAQPSTSSSLSTPTKVSLSRGPQVGALAPDFSLKSLDGATVRLSDLHGRPVILDFWAPWCTPCREELLMLQSAQSNHLEILGIAVREPQDSVIAFATDSELGFPLLLDLDGQVGDLYQVRGLPTSLFVDREGRIVARYVGPINQATLDSHLSSWLAEATVSPSDP